jgi:hypothetical protein
MQLELSIAVSLFDDRLVDEVGSGTPLTIEFGLCIQMPLMAPMPRPYWAELCRGFKLKVWEREVDKQLVSVRNLIVFEGFA